MGTNILFWNCHVIGLKRKKLELYLKENVIDVIALNETFLTKKHNFKIPGYDTIRNDCSTGQGGGVAFLVKNGLDVNKEYRNNDLNIITNNEALAIELELSNKQNLPLATIYCPNGNPSLTLFQTINNLSAWQCHVCWRFQFETSLFWLCQKNPHLVLCSKISMSFPESITLFDLCQ